MRPKYGFTLIELMVVVIIVGVLAAVAVPLYRSNVKKAMSSEGAALLGSVLTAEKVYYQENATYTTTQANLGLETTGNKYFTAYTVSSATSAGFTATSSGTGGAAGVTVTMTFTNAAGASIAYTGL